MSFLVNRSLRQPRRPLRSWSRHWKSLPRGIEVAIALLWLMVVPSLAQAQEATPAPAPSATETPAPGASEPEPAPQPAPEATPPALTPATPDAAGSPSNTLPADLTSPNLPVFPDSEAARQTPGAPVNPLDLTEPDPLLPNLVIQRPLSPQERSVLTAALNELQQQASARLQTGDLAGAFDLWNRELRLRRYLGVREEVAALGRVGEIAWRESQTTEVRFITMRLEQIQQEVQAQPSTDYDLLLQIAQAYQSMRSQSQAIALYDQLLAQARQQQARQREQQILLALAQLHLAWFDYPNAADAYQQLLTLVRTTGDPVNEIEYLKQLSYIYQQDNQPQQAIATQQQLVDIYQQQKNFLPIPGLKVEIGDNYVALGRPDLAAPSYQEAYATARGTQEYAYAADALQRLADLYVALERPNDAIVVYQLLLDVQRQAYNNLGVMNTYDQIGQMYRAAGSTTQAVAAFRQALQIARQLNYKVSYFDSQIQQLTQPPAAPAPAPAAPPQ